MRSMQSALQAAQKTAIAHPVASSGSVHVVQAKPASAKPTATTKAATEVKHEVKHSDQAPPQVSSSPLPPAVEHLNAEVASQSVAKHAKAINAKVTTTANAKVIHAKAQ